MSDGLTDEERAAIAAFPKQKVQRIPTGKCAFGVRYVWNGKDLVQQSGADLSWRGLNGALDLRKRGRA